MNELLAVKSLHEALSAIPDSRRARGVRYPQGALLTLCILAFMCGAQNLSQIHRFARNHGNLLEPLGFRSKTPPSVPTLSRVLGSVPLEGLQTALGRWLCDLVEASRSTGAIASVDGKASRSCGAHVLNVFLHDLEQVIWAAPVGKKANEISAFRSGLASLLESYPLLQLVVGDAMFTGEPLCSELIENGRHYLFQVKADQPHLLEKFEIVFSPFLSKPVSSAAFTGEKKRRLRPGSRERNP